MAGSELTSIKSPENLPNLNKNNKAFITSIKTMRVYVTLY